MKKILLVAALSVSLNAHSQTDSIVCGLENSAKIYSTLKNLNVDEMNEFCQAQIFSGDGICYEGSAKNAIRILKKLSMHDVLGDEYRIISLKQLKKESGLTYDVWDGPNELVDTSVTIKPCR